ncbi:hypothetical protein EB796_019922 [Bugula neritina]|uniref:Uncharacterized protein n=1 Tax=Bugula neritina TaxID=10212 RepID=A0A7J7J7X3_BUGNE|nr:hypothetical protein EB796_019922 [Bugula neritina]
MHRVLVAVKASVTHTSADCVYSQKLTETQQASMRKQEQIAAQQQQQIKLQAEALENARIQQEITAKQFEEQKVMLLEQQAQLVQQQQEALQMALLAKQQAEQAANSAADQALKKAEAMKRRITPPAKPGLSFFNLWFFN